MAEIPDEIRERLEAAERVCVLYGWTGSGNSERGKALYMLWLRWTEVSGNDCSPEANPGLTDDVIADLARQRDDRRDSALMRLGLPPDPLPPGPVDPRSDPCGAPPTGGRDG